MSTATQPISGTFVADPVHSSFQFAVKHMKVATFRAGFDEVEARLSDGVLEGRAKVESISVTNPPELREHLVGSPDFFAGQDVVFRSTDVELREDKIERREAKLAELEERLGKKEAELATYVAQVQGAMKRREDEWWKKQTGDAAPDGTA